MTATEREAAPVDTGSPAEQMHYMHLACQTGDGYVIAICGFLLDKDERDDDNSKNEPDCPECTTPPLTCANCGASSKDEE